MSMLINIFIVLAILVVCVLVIALFAKKEFTVQREIIINDSNRKVFDFIRFLRNHRMFSKWATKEKGKRNETIGLDGTVGFVATWDNYKERAGLGEMEIRRLVHAERIDLEHRYLKPIKGKGNSLISTTFITEAQTKVKWVYTGVSRYPINILTSILNMDRIIGKDLEDALHNMKRVIEKPTI
jgi:hypothetical protein